MIRLTKKIVLYLHLLLLTAISLQALDVVSSDPKNGQSGVPLNSKIMIKFDQGFDVSNLLPTSLIDEEKIQLGLKLPFFVIEKKYYNPIDIKNCIRYGIIVGKYDYSGANNNTISFIPYEHSLGYEKEYVICFDSWLDFNHSNIKPIFFSTTKDLHHVVDVSDNLKSKKLNCKDTLSVKFNRPITEKVLIGKEFLNIDALIGTFIVNNEEQDYREQVATQKWLSADKCTAYILPISSFIPDQKYFLKLNGSLLTGQTDDYTEYALQCKSHYIVDYTVKFQNTIASYSDTNEVINENRTGRIVYNYDESIYYKAPEISGDYYFSHWECSNKDFHALFNDNIIKGKPFDCSNAPIEVMLSAVYKPAKLDTVTFACTNTVGGRISVKEFHDSLGGGKYTLKRLPSSYLEVNAIPADSFRFEKWSNLDSLDFDSASSNVFVTAKMLNKGNEVIKTWLDKEPQDRDFGCPVFTDEPFPGFKIYVSLQTLTEFDDYYGMSYAFAKECGGSYVDYTDRNWGRVMRNFVTVSIDGIQIDPNEWFVSGPGMAQIGLAQYSKTKDGNIFNVTANILPPYDQEWEVNVALVTDNSRRSGSYYPSNYNFDDIYLNTLPYTEQLIADGSTPAVSMKLFLRKKMHKLTYSILPNTASGFSVIDPKWQIDADYKKSTFYTSKGVRKPQIEKPADGSHYTYTNYIHHGKSVSLRPLDTPLRPGSSDLDLSKLNWKAPLQGAIQLDTKSWLSTMTQDKKAELVVDDVFRCIYVSLDVESETNGGMDRKRYNPEELIGYNETFLANIMIGQGATGSAVVYLEFNKDVDLQSLQDNLYAKDVIGIRPWIERGVDSSPIAAKGEPIRFDCSTKRTYYQGNGNVNSDPVSNIFRNAGNYKKAWFNLHDVTYAQKININLNGVKSTSGDELEGGNHFDFRIEGPRLVYYLDTYHSKNDHDDGDGLYDLADYNEELATFSAVSYDAPAKSGTENYYENLPTRYYPNYGDYVTIRPNGKHELTEYDIIIAQFNRRVKTQTHTLVIQNNITENDCIGDCNDKYISTSIGAMANIATTVVAKYLGLDFPGLGKIAEDIAKEIIKEFSQVEKIGNTEIHLNYSGENNNKNACWGIGPCKGSVTNQSNPGIFKFIVASPNHNLIIRVNVNG